MDFLSHGYDFGLTNCRVKRFLHLFFKSDLSFPEKNLAFSFNNFSKNFSLALLKFGNLVFKLNGLVFKFLKFLLELILNVEISIGEDFGAALVFVEEVVELVHFEVEVLEGDLQLADLLVVRLDVVVEADALLLEHRLAGAQLVNGALDLVHAGLLVNQLLLVGDPVLVGLLDLLALVGNLLDHILQLDLQRAVVLLVVLPILGQLSELPVQAVHLQLALLDVIVLVLYVLLLASDLLFLLLELGDEVGELLLEQIVLGLRV